ncbi:MAG: chemotaxis protein CheW, partial [Myxococcales bacterium]|nr:chemotaxis protein CheW [Myxococcales bacterium]
MTYILVRLHGTSYAVPAEHTLEVLHGARVTVTPVPGGDPAMLGVLDLRGTLLPAIDLRVVMGMTSFAAELTSVRELLAARERDHVQWLDELRRCASCGDPFTKATDPTRCAFGVWYSGLQADPKELGRLTGQRLAQQAVVASWDAPHRAIHALADRVLEQAGRGDTDAAQHLLRTGESELAGLRASFKEFLTLFEEQRRAMLVVCQAGDQLVALAVDEVLAVEELDESRISELPPMVATAQRCLSGTYRREDGELVHLVEPRRVAATT